MTTAPQPDEMRSPITDTAPIPLPLDEHHLRTLLTCITHSGVMLIYRPDTSQPDIWWSPGSAELLGIEPTELGTTVEALHDLIHPEDLPAIAERSMAQPERTQAARDEREYRLRRKDGEYLRVRSVVSICQPPDPPQGGASLEVIRLLESDGRADQAAFKLGEDALSTVLAQDITRVKAEQAAQLKHERARTRTLVREVHHRIKNHLQGLIGLLRHHARSETTGAELVNSAVSQIHSIAAMHGSLAKSGKPSIDIASLLHEIVAAYRATSLVPLRFVASSPVDAPELSEDEAMPLAIAIGELLTNAIKHTRNTERAEVRIVPSYAADRAEITITNSPAHLPQGFHLDQWTQRQSGLALVFTLLAGGPAQLAMKQEGDSVVATLTIGPAPAKISKS